MFFLTIQNFFRILLTTYVLYSEYSETDSEEFKISI